MSLERLYYNDPFSNIVISCDIQSSINKTAVIDALNTTIRSCQSLGLTVSLDDNGYLKYCAAVHDRNINNISFSVLDEESIIKSLISHPFDLQNGETIKIIVQSKEFGYTIFFCMHHIIGDANSLILLIKKFVTIMQNSSDTIFLEKKDCSLGLDVEIDSYAKYLINTINRQYPRKQYSKSDYLSMVNHLYNDNELEITKLVVDKNDYTNLKQKCKLLGISITSYIAARIFNIQQIETLCLPMDLRETGNCFGNYVGRIDISARNIIKQDDVNHQAALIDKHIKSVLKNRLASAKSEAILEQIHPGFYDDVIYDVYSNYSNPFARKMSNLIGYKDSKPTTYVSNLKIVEFQCEGNCRISNLCFYPPSPIERVSTIGIVTLNGQMVITIQKFRKEETL